MVKILVKKEDKALCYLALSSFVREVSYFTNGVASEQVLFYAVLIVPTFERKR